LYLDTIVLFVSFILNILICGYGIFADKQAYSLNKVFWLFTCIFLALIPFGQFVCNSFSWGKHFETATLLQANGIILFCLFCYTLIRHKSGSFPKQKTDKAAPFKLHQIRLWVLFIMTTLGLILLSGAGLFWRSAQEKLITNSSLDLLVDKGLKGCSLISILLFIQLFKTKQLSKQSFFIVLFLGFVSNFPLAVPRYWTGTFYLAISLSLLKHYFQEQRNLFNYIILLGTLFLFPIMSIARYSRVIINQKFSAINDVFTFSFLGGDFDAYTSLCSTLQYVHAQGITWGKQLATVILFFVPRQIWQSKSIGSGALVNQLPHSDFSNFCSPFIAEGYINFGIIGSLAFISLLAWMISRYDQFFGQKKGNTYLTYFYPIAIGMLYFILRGDLLSSFAYLVGFYVSGWLTYRFVISEV
jgi:hypothetical protein